MGLLPTFVGQIMYTILQFCVLVLAVTAIPLPQYGPKGGSKLLCTTYWGITKKCNGVEYSLKGKNAFGCDTRTNVMKAAAALAIVGSVVALLLLVLCIIAMVAGGKGAPAIILTILTALNVLILTVPWAVIAGVMNNKVCKLDLQKPSKTNNYRPGFAIMVAAWGAEIINFVILMLTMC